MAGNGADVRYEDLLRDGRNEELMQSTRIHAAFDAIYCCCRPAGTLDDALESLNLSVADAALVSKLAAWVLNVAPLGPLPMSPDEAIALAERFHKKRGANDAARDSRIVARWSRKREAHDCAGRHWAREE